LASRFLSANHGNQLQFTSDMKKNFVLLVLIPFSMICSCQKQDSAAEQQLAQRKAELDARQQVLNERQKELALRETVLNEREQALAKKEKAAASVRTITPDVQSPGQVRDPAQLKADPAQLKAEKERRIKALPPEVQRLIPDASQLQAERDRRLQQLSDQKQRTLEEFQRIQAQMQNTGAMSTSAARPAAVATPPTELAIFPSAESPSPSPSPTPQ
jgi:hypothetical protein